MKHYHAGSTVKQRPGTARRKRSVQDAIDASVDALCTSWEGLGANANVSEQTAFAVGFECAAYIALGSPELIQWWVRTHQRQWKEKEEFWHGLQGREPDPEFYATVEGMPEHMARFFGGLVTKTGAFNDVLGIEE